MMNDNRIVEHPILGKLSDKESVNFTFDGIKYTGYAGDTIASALLANGIRTLRVHEETGTPRGIYCNIGHCYECRVTIDGQPGIRACLTEIKAEMQVERGKIQPHPLKKTEDDNELPRTYAEFHGQVSGRKEAGTHD